MPKKSKKIIQNSLEEIKAQNTIFLDLSKLNSFTDFLVITSGTSSRHMSAIKDKLLEDLKNNKIIQSIPYTYFAELCLASSLSFSPENQPFFSLFGL